MEKDVEKPKAQVPEVPRPEGRDEAITEVEQLAVVAYHLYDYLRLKPLVPVLSGKVISSSPRELQIQYGKKQFLFVYRFGSLVFVNMDSDTVEEEIRKVSLSTGQKPVLSTTESYDVRPGKTTQVEFDYVQLRTINRTTLRMVAMTVGQSAALEYFESQTERMLADSGRRVRELSRRGRVPLGNRKLIRMIGTIAGARQEILSNLAVMDAPEETWDNRSLEALHRELQDNFEIELRSRILDKKLALVQENIELLADLVSTKRAHLLEALIVILIVLEIFLAFFGLF